MKSLVGLVAQLANAYARRPPTCDLPRPCNAEDLALFMHVIPIVALPRNRDLG